MLEKSASILFLIKLKITHVRRDSFSVTESANHLLKDINESNQGQISNTKEPVET